MPDIKEYIPEYTPLWRGESECNKCDAILLPTNSDFQVMIPAPNEFVTYFLFLNGSDTDSYIVFDIVEEVGNHLYCNISIEFDGQIFMRTIQGLDFFLPCGCYEFELGTILNGDETNEVTRLGVKWQFVTYCENSCKDIPLKIEYQLGCGDEVLNFTYYLDAVLARQPLSIADELNAVSPSGLSRRIFSRTQQTKELRIRPLTLATHELLEYVLNLPTFEINGTAYTQAEGEVYTYVDSGSSGYYVGRVALVSGGNVFRSCCETVAPSS